MRDSRIDVMRGTVMLMMISDHCAFSPFSTFGLQQNQFCDASELFFLFSGYSCMAALGRRLDGGRFRQGLSGVGYNLLRIYLAQIFMVGSAFLLMKVWSYFSVTDFINFSIEERSDLRHGVLSSNLFEYRWSEVPSILFTTAAPPYFDVLRTYLVLIAAFPLMWFGLRRAPWMTMAAAVMLWALAHGPHGLAFRDTIDGRIWFFNPFAWQLIFLSGALLRIFIEHRATLPKLPAVTALSFLIIILGLTYQISGFAVPHLPMFKTNLSPIRMLNAFAIVYLALSREWGAWLMRSRIIDAIRIVGCNSLVVYVAGTLISLIVDMADAETGRETISGTLVVSAGLLAAVGVAHLAERRRRRRKSMQRFQVNGVTA